MMCVKLLRNVFSYHDVHITINHYVMNLMMIDTYYILNYNDIHCCRDECTSRM
jgi:hypothetical protein